MDNRGTTDDCLGGDYHGRREREFEPRRLGLQQDTDLPIGRTFSSTKMTGSGDWTYGGYTFPSALTVFSATSS